MDDGTTGGSSSGHRRTISGPFPKFEDPMDDTYIFQPDEESERLQWTAQTAATSIPVSIGAPSPRSTVHKRSISGNILGRLNFLKGTADDGRPPSRDKEQQPPQSPKSAKSTKSRKSIDDDNDTTVSPVSPVKGENAMAAALASTKTRKRKGSLRKTALLGGKRLVTEGRERKNSLLQRGSSYKQPLITQPPVQTPSSYDSDKEVTSTQAHNSDSEASLGRQSSYENINANTSTDSGWSEPLGGGSVRLSLLTDHTATHASRKQSTELSSPLNFTSPVSQASYMSTTDDDDVLTFDSRASSFGALGLSIKKPLATGTSYFPPVASVSQESLSRRLSAKQSRSSPLSHSITSPSTYPEPEPHDYTETEYWGWVILFVTWLTFTVGMGSCLEIWSWAWDVGETPYAPPELEDDETLPIVGYYPALIVLAGVVAWIWITIAWLGMKYFRHAKIEV